MSDGVLSLDDFDTSGNGDASTDAETNDDDSEPETDELREICEAIGADFDHAEAYLDNNSVERETLVDFAELLRDNAELTELLEEYRMLNDKYRILQIYLLNADAEYTRWADRFYYGDGDNDNPGDGSYNDVQYRVRNESDGNLIWYKALFPEPQAEYYPGDPVLWGERPDDDTHIYVSDSFVEQYLDAGCTMVVDGDTKPRPPSDSELEAMGDDTQESGGQENPDEGDAFDPTQYSISELRDRVDGLTLDMAIDALAAEQNRDDQYAGGRQGAVELLERRINDLHDSDDEQAAQESDDGDDGEQQSLDNVAGGDDREYPDVWDMTSKEIAAEVDTWDLEVCDKMLAKERQHPEHDGGRKGVKQQIESRISTIESSGGADATGGSDDDGEAGIAEKAGAALDVAPKLDPDGVHTLHQHDWSKQDIVDFFRGNDVDPDSVVGLVADEGWTKDEVFELMG
jgi:hypothetical protein